MRTQLVTFPSATQRNKFCSFVACRSAKQFLTAAESETPCDLRRFQSSPLDLDSRAIQRFFTAVQHCLARVRTVTSYTPHSLTSNIFSSTNGVSPAQGLDKTWSHCTNLHCVVSGRSSRSQCQGSISPCLVVPLNPIAPSIHYKRPTLFSIVL